MVKRLLVGLFAVTAVSVTAGLASANQAPNQANLTGYTKDQCKDGGWQELGFRNQGQCVSYFAKQQHS